MLKIKAGIKVVLIVVTNVLVFISMVPLLMFGIVLLQESFGILEYIEISNSLAAGGLTALHFTFVVFFWLLLIAIFLPSRDSNPWHTRVLGVTLVVLNFQTLLSYDVVQIHPGILISAGTFLAWLDYRVLGEFKLVIELVPSIKKIENVLPLQPNEPAIV